MRIRKARHCRMQGPDNEINVLIGKLPQTARMVN
jgi:hypothetical protein